MFDSMEILHNGHARFRHAASRLLVFMKPRAEWEEGKSPPNLFPPRFYRRAPAVDSIPPFVWTGTRHLEAFIWPGWSGIKFLALVVGCVTKKTS
jgi:hypothetical protein